MPCFLKQLPRSCVHKPAVYPTSSTFCKAIHLTNEGWQLGERRVTGLSPFLTFLLEHDAVHLQKFPLPLVASPKFQGLSLAQPQTPLKFLPHWPDPLKQIDSPLKFLDFATQPCPGATFRYIELFAGIGGRIDDIMSEPQVRWISTGYGQIRWQLRLLK